MSHSILSGASAEPKDICFHGMNSHEQQDLRVDGLTGLSPRLLHLIQEINRAAHYRPGNPRKAFEMAQLICDNLRKLQQTTECGIAPQFERSEYDTVRELITITAELYRQAAQMYAAYRIQG